MNAFYPIYRIFRSYLRFFYNHIQYRKVYRIGLENIPSSNTPLLIACNHQNCMNDPLGLVLTFRDRKPSILARADIFEKSTLANNFLRSIGLLPAFRMMVDGEEAMKKNEQSFKITESQLANGNTIIIFPEGMHQNRHWLGAFSSGYTKMAFEAAKMNNFEKDLIVLPVCNHYSNYFGIQNQLVLKFGKPISVQQFFELYKTKPRTAQRQLDALVREQIENRMLNITDDINYNAIDFLRNSYGNLFAKANNLNPNKLPQKLEADKLLFAKLEEAKNNNPALVEKLYKLTNNYIENLKQLNICDAEVESNSGLLNAATQLIASFFVTIITFAIALPNILLYIAPTPLINRLKDKMFESSIRYGLSVLLTIPLIYGGTFLAIGLAINFYIASICMALLPAMGVLQWSCYQFLLKSVRKVRFAKLSHAAKQNLIATRNGLFMLCNKVVE
ncbi:MAG: 1-acyl-sn-glycerol-3-phosphate acyltransferase [Salinivirgaceae bacterium]|nr:1-acyl-sn-glycerol-3-phosphate acyltransferase [Salinivirgaceae bacterium]